MTTNYMISTSIVLTLLLFFFVYPSINAFAGEDYLSSSDVIDSNHQSIINKVNEITDPSMTQRQVAIAIHDYVRDKKLNLDFLALFTEFLQVTFLSLR